MPTRILIVDDDDALRRALSRTLRGHGYEVDEAGDAHEALGAIDRQAPDLVLTDIMMPGGDGVELINAIRHRMPRPGILAMSGRGSMGALDLLHLAEKLGADLSLNKPFSTDELLLAISELETRVPFGSFETRSGDGQRH
ncbi:MAG: response regulator [Pseudomonadota bacterium]